MMALPDETPNKNSRGQYDPGWNDPPTLSYNAQASATKPRNLLNKRVAFPLSNSPNTTVQNTNLPPILPPGLAPVNPIPFMPSSPNLIHKPDESNVLTPCQEVHDSETVSLIEVTGILNKILDESPELGNKLDNIRKRLGVMESMWDERKLVGDVQIKMLKIAKALESSDTATADELHKSLMIDHIGSVGPWMVAIKQLIFHCSAKNELLAIDNES